MSEPQLAQALRQMGIDPIGMSRLDMLREYSRVLRNTTPEVATESEMRNTQEQLPSERALKQDQQTAKYIPQDLSNEPSNPTRTDTTGAGEGATDASTRILTTEELSTITPEEALAGYRESLAQNNNKVVSREALKNLADTLDIKIKDGAQKISGTEMESRAGQNITPQVVNIDAIFSGVNDKNARTFRRKAVDLAMRLFRNSQVEVTDTRTMTQINKSGITKTFSDNITPSKVQSANNIKDIVKQGIYGFTTSNINDKNGIRPHSAAPLFRGGSSKQAQDQHILSGQRYKEDNGGKLGA